MCLCNEAEEKNNAYNEQYKNTNIDKTHSKKPVSKKGIKIDKKIFEKRKDRSEEIKNYLKERGCLYKPKGGE